MYIARAVTAAAAIRTLFVKRDMRAIQRMEESDEEGFGLFLFVEESVRKTAHEDGSIGRHIAARPAKDEEEAAEAKASYECAHYLPPIQGSFRVMMK